MITLQVDGMTCQGCVRSVTAAVGKAAPAAEATVDLASGRVEVTGAEDAGAIVAAIEAAGFDARAVGGA